MNTASVNWLVALSLVASSLAAQERGVDVQVVYDEWAAQTALRYLVPPNEVAGSVVYLASDAASWVTGKLILVAGGRTHRSVGYTPSDGR